MYGSSSASASRSSWWMSQSISPVVIGTGLLRVTRQSTTGAPALASGAYARHAGRALGLSTRERSGGSPKSQEVEVGALVGLQDALGDEPAPAALGPRRRAERAPAARQLVLADEEVQPPGAGVERDDVAVADQA